MSIPTITITGNVLPPNNVAAGGTVTFELNTVAVDLGSGVVVPRKVSTPILSGGAISQAIWPNAAGEGPSRYSVYLEMIPSLDGDCPVRIKLGEIAIAVSPSTQDIGALIAAGAAATGGGALLEFQFANRAALVAKVASGLVPIPGFTYFAGGLGYLGKSGATDIPDLPGLVPAGEATVAHYGLGAAALTAMAADKGYVRFDAPFALAADATVQVTLIFAAGGYVEVADTFTLTVQGTIESPRQWIFRGDGDVALGGAGTVGEAAREVHASWFGVVPGIIDNPSNDQAIGIQRISTAMGNLREGIIKFDIGNYEMWSTVLVNRAIGIEGDWSRRTVFNCRADAFIPFRTNGEAVRFEGIQFEHKDQLTTERASPYIKILHPACQVRDVAAGRAFRSVELASSNCIVERLSGFYNVAGSAGSSLIAVRGFHHTISELRCQSATFGPEAIVHLGAEITENANTTAHVHVAGIQNNSPARPFIIEATNHSITSCSVDGVHDFAAAVRAGGAIRTLSGANNLDGVILSGLVASGNVQPALEIIMSGTASLRDVSVISLDANGTVGVGVAVTRSAGLLSTVSIGQGVNVRNRATPISTTGAGVGLIVAPGVIPNSAGVVSHTVTIPDDDVYMINFGADRFASRLSVVTNGGVFGTWRARAASSPTLTAMGTISGIAAVTGALTGTTGADGAITVSVAAGGLYYVENRSGASITVMIEVAG